MPNAKKPEAPKRARVDSSSAVDATRAPRPSRRAAPLALALAALLTGCDGRRVAPAPPTAAPAPSATPAPSAVSPPSAASAAPARPAIEAGPAIEPGCRGAAFDLDDLFAHARCAADPTVPRGVAPTGALKVTLEAEGGPLVARSGAATPLVAVITNAGAADAVVDLWLGCAKQSDEIHLRAMRPGSPDHADSETGPAKGQGCGVSWGCATRKRRARVVLEPGGKAKLHLVYEAFMRGTHCDPTTQSTRPLPPGSYELELTLPIDEGGPLRGRSPLTVVR